MAAAANQRKKHSPAAVVPIIFSSGALLSCDDDLLLQPEDRKGRHSMRVELSTIHTKIAFKISVQLWMRRNNSVVPLAQACVSPCACARSDHPCFGAV